MKLDCKDYTGCVVNNLTKVENNLKAPKMISA
jgi:hypothetical protein